MDNFTNAPYTNIYLGGLQRAVQNLVNASYGPRKSPIRTIMCASAAEDVVVNSILPKLLDIQAYFHAKCGSPDKAIVEAQRMIGYCPHLPIGYLRKGSIFAMYGQQIQAIEAFDEGLQNVKPSGKAQTRELESARNTAVKMLNEIRIDFWAKLPIEIASEITSYLPQETKATCLTVSRQWRHRIIECENLWSHLSINDDSHCCQLVNESPNLGHHVRHLTISTSNKIARSKWIKMLMGAHFTNVKSLELEDCATQDLETHISPLLTAFWVMNTTLTSLDLDFGSNETIISLSDILWSCVNITDLTYSTDLPLPSLAVNDHSILDSNISLVNLELYSCNITGDSISMLLQRCQRLRRLVMDECCSTALDPVYTYAPASLEILGINSVTTPVPELAQKINDQSSSGLHTIYVEIEANFADIKRLLQLLYKHKDTLEIIHAYLSPYSENIYRRINETKLDIKFKRVVSLQFSSRNERAQQFMLQTIRDTTTLSSLHVKGVTDVPALVSTVLQLPPLTDVQLEGTYFTSDDNTALVDLFDTYASLHSAAPNALNFVGLRNCGELSDDVLAALANIKTLQKVDLERLRHVTSEGLNEFFVALGDQLVSLSLTHMKGATDTVFTTLGNSKCLKAVHLDDLTNVTDEGLQRLIDAQNQTLSKLTVKACPRITEECISYAKRKLNTVVYD